MASAAHRETNPAIKTILEEQALALWTKAHQARGDAMYQRGGALMKTPTVNFHGLVNQIVLDCSLARWFAYNGRRDEVMAAIALQRTRARDTEGQVLDFLIRQCGVAMTDATNDPTPIPTALNVGALAKHFGVARSTIRRRLKKGWVPPTVGPRKARKVVYDAPNATVSAPRNAPRDAPSGRTMTTATPTAALALATCSAAFSVNGLTAIFAGAFWSVIGLGIAFEVGKLSAVAWLGQ